MSNTAWPTDLSSSNPEPKADEAQSKPSFRIEDRRVFAHGDGAETNATPVQERRLPTYVEELQAQKELAEKKLAEKIQWIDEEVARIRERLTREQERKLEAEKRKIAQAFLEIADNFERALSAAEANPNLDTLLNGLKMIQGGFLSKLQQLGVQVLNLEGKPFDPQVSEAIAVTNVETPEKDHTVIEVLENGYQWGDQLLRPAKVRVGRFAG